MTNQTEQSTCPYCDGEGWLEGGQAAGFSPVACYDCNPEERPRKCGCVSENLLGEALEALRGLLAMAEHGGPVRVESGHHCGPDANCDMICMDARRDAELMDSARAVLAKAAKEGR